MSQDRSRAAQMVITRRGELGLTQEQLADLAQVDKKTIYNLESGERWPQARNRFKIEKALGWTAGSLDAFSEGRDIGYKFPTRAELIDDGLRRRGMTGEEAAGLAGIAEEEWKKLASGSATISEARTEDPSLTPALARAALVLGIVPEQLANAGQERAAETLRQLAERAFSNSIREGAPAGKADPHLQRLLEVWPQLGERQRRGLIDMIEDVLSLSEPTETGRKPDQAPERRTG